MNLIKLLVISILLSSCCEIHDVTKYTLDKIIVTRIDECDKTTFYYGDDIDKNKGEIWVEYSGINDGFKGYLKFHKNGKVSLLSGDGYFQVKNIDSSYFEYKRIASYERPKIGENVCYINLATKFEHEDNVSEGSGVTVEYIDKKW
jgi:hypothetical protein